MSLLSLLPSSAASLNPGMSGLSFGVPQAADSYSNMYMPYPPSQPPNVVRDPTMGSLISLNTLSDTAEVLTLPDMLVFSTINATSNFLYTIIMPVMNTKNITTFRFTVHDYPQVPIMPTSELGVPRYLHNRKWTFTTTISRWAIGNRYSMEFLKHAQGEQQQIADKMQIAVSFGATLDLIVLNSLKNAHKHLRLKLESFGTYTYTDVSAAMEWQRHHFAALQKREHGWSLFVQKAKEKMQSYNGSATALIVDRSISLLFPEKSELINYYKSGQPTAPRINSPEQLMSENTPVDKIFFTNFKPAVVGALLSPMQHIVQVGNWFISQDLPIFTSNSQYPEVYSTQCRDIQIYDQELDSFVTLKLKDLARESGIFKPVDGSLDVQIFGNDTSFIGDLFSSKSSIEGDSFVDLLVESIIYKMCKMGNTTAAILNEDLENGLKEYEKMATQPINNTWINAIVTTGIEPGYWTNDNNTSIIPALKDIRIPGIGDNNLCMFPPSHLNGYLSWGGFLKIREYWYTQTSLVQAASDAGWIRVCKFIDAVKLIVRYWRNNLTHCGLFDTIKNLNDGVKKTAEESLVDQIFNFNASFTVWAQMNDGVREEIMYTPGTGGRAERSLVGGVTGTKLQQQPNADHNKETEQALASIKSTLLQRLFDDGVKSAIGLIEKVKDKDAKRTLRKILNGLFSHPISKLFFRVTPKSPVTTFNIDESANVDTLYRKNTLWEYYLSVDEVSRAYAYNIPSPTTLHWAFIPPWVIRMYEMALSVCLTVLVTRTDVIKVIENLEQFVNTFQDLFKMDQTIYNEIRSQSIEDIKGRKLKLLEDAVKLLLDSVFGQSSDKMEDLYNRLTKNLVYAAENLDAESIANKKSPLFGVVDNLGLTENVTSENIYSTLSADIIYGSNGPITKQIIKKLGTGNVSYAARKKSDIEASLNDTFFDGVNDMTFAGSEPRWVKTSLRVSQEQIETLYHETDYRVHILQSDQPVRNNNDKTVTSALYENFDAFKQHSDRVAKLAATDDIDAWMLPFVKAEYKCRSPIDGISLKDQRVKQIGDDLFGYRLNLDGEIITKLSEKIHRYLGAHRSPLHTVVGLLTFTTKFNQTNSDFFINHGIIYPIDFIVWRLWANYVANIGFLVNPGAQNLGFVAISGEDHRSGETPMTKEGMFNSSAWMGGVVLRPENTMTLYNSAITSFGHGGGSGFIDWGNFTEDDRANYKRPDIGKSSSSLLVSAIHKGTCPDRIAISITGKLPEGSYETSGLQLSAAERESKPHYTTCEYYSKLWDIRGDATSLAEALGPDGKTLTTNLIGYKGTTKYYNPFKNQYSVMTLNTGHFGPNEGPGCRDARLNGTVFPNFEYAKNPGIEIVA